MIQAAFGGASMDFHHGTPGRRGAGGLGGGREVSCLYPVQANIPHGCSCLEQARNTITASFQMSFSLVSAFNRTTRCLAEAAAEPSALWSCASLWGPLQP